MSASQLIARPRRLRLTICGTLLVCCAGAFPALASASTVSSNWAGYVAVPSSTAKNFKSVSGTWTQPSVSCTAGVESFSAVWVGLGGYRENSNALEQIGSEADCSRTGTASYSTWFELIPAGPVGLKIKTAPGETMQGSVTVKGHGVTLRLRNLTTGAYDSITRRVSAVDTSSAEWIVEAPSTCFNESECHTLALSNFGTVSFSSATATAGAQTAAIANGAWSALELELRQGEDGFAPGSWRDARAQTDSTVISAAPSVLMNPLSGFSVSWATQQLQAETLPPPVGPLPG